ncbi:hypothetical protein [Patulibacter sp. SYSU D01012]|uniref:hypothetical protein n=1 Tax=Patulibacter sp. SYSU D01012 TaxID=2817381 RepID=UPI001B3042AD|nr:hypothetical protein [Patulibacter sp. SYSU D01012]
MPTARTAVLLAAAVLATGAAGCGGSGGDPEQYASTWNGVCRDITSAQETLQNDLVALQGRVSTTDVTALTKAAAAPIGKLSDAVSTALERVRGLDAPDEYADFQKRVDGSVDATIRVFRELKDATQRGDTRALQEMGRTTRPTDVVPSLPAGLKTRAKDCSSF